ncbi:hypothetical protein CY34DRAFT_108490 [Suillus luteus UH-Slu-Lm8-n1]|uniref:Uncharacterized protein n=1 Tax=Suillus luteus UH-Slu-Lm8-n1 TaxID=930992 RepID=A0A0C9ZMI9_9AGAM|nr:hypothetical protein CY34DRAFT_108490 [Suillus luteus UH-Slu-Lm8-n1]
MVLHQEAVILAQEVLGAILWTYHTKKVRLDNSYFPEYKVPMSRLGNTMHKKRVSAAAAKLLKTSEYLWLPDSSEMKGVLSGFRDSGTDKSVDKLMAIPECHVELEEMLKEWAEGMMGELCNDLDSAVGSDNINIII